MAKESMKAREVKRKKLVEKYSDIISSSDQLELDSKALDFMHEVMLPSLKVPIILENYEGEKLVINIDIPYDENTTEYKDYLKSQDIIDMQLKMDKNNNLLIYSLSLSIMPNKQIEFKSPIPPDN